MIRKYYFKSDSGTENDKMYDLCRGFDVHLKQMMAHTRTKKMIQILLTSTLLLALAWPPFFLLQTFVFDTRINHLYSCTYRITMNKTKKRVHVKQNKFESITNEAN